ncbi:hypothetical protein AB0L70_16015 [Kribbella sp. NPDC051952]|uniref:hypothetical protein n=1 Tax=Kribbella sp. NPDC051952 TaxID=3154851 RepID=UPI00343ACA53
MDRFGARSAEPIQVGCSGATVVRLDRGAERLYYKAGPGVDDEGDRLTWLGSTGFPCPQILDRGNNWLLTSELTGRDADPDDPRIERYITLDNTGDYMPR